MKSGTNKVVEEIIEVVRKNNNFFVTAHLHPDGDTLGSELALASWLKRLGKKVTVANFDPVPQIYRFLPDINSIRQAKNIKNSFDVGFILECSEPERIGEVIDLKQMAQVVNIDHHVSSMQYGDINWFDPKASSVAEQIYRLIKISGENLTRKEALCLYVGIVTDTGKFQQCNTTPQSHLIAAELLNHNLRPEEVHQKIYATKSYSLLKLLGLALSSLKLASGGKIGYQEINQQAYKKLGYPEEDEETINYPLAIPRVKVNILFREFPNLSGEIKVGFRSRNKVNVYRIAKHFGGGGHFNASGCILKGEMEEVKKRVLDYVRNFIR